MKFFLSVVAVLAFASCVYGQTVATSNPNNYFPLLDHNGIKISVNGIVDPSLKVPDSPKVLPDFNTFQDVSLRYSAEVNASAPVDATISYESLPVNGQTFNIVIRNCNSALQKPVGGAATSTKIRCKVDGSFTALGNYACQYSQCPYSDAFTVTSSFSRTYEWFGTNYSAFAGSYQFNSLWGTNYIELIAYGVINGKVEPVSYILNVGVFSGAGTNMMSLDTYYVSSSFDQPYTMQTSQYRIAYSVQSPYDPTSGSTVTAIVPFYLAAQTSVNTIFVQECPGISCDSCLIDSIPRKSITRGGAPLADADSSFVFNPKLGQNGEYRFPAKVTNKINDANPTTPNCLRLINQIDAGIQGKNEYTITISVPFSNCGIYTTCAACSAIAPTASAIGCGWCMNNIFTGAGSCRVGRDYAYTSTASDVPQTCDNSNPLQVRYVTSAAQCNVVIRGDPRISGLQGQDFQVHGTPNEYFNLVTSETLQVNSRFIYLDEAKCDNFTTCFSHPGTYIDEVGVMVGENKVRIVARAINEAAQVFIDGKEVLVSAHKHTAGKILVTFANTRRIVVKTPQFMMTISQSDKFFNIESALLKTELLDQGSKFVKLESSRAIEANTIMHGLIGQTWRNNVYAGGREYEGEVSDYQVADGIWGSDFAFNLYQH